TGPHGKPKGPPDPNSKKNQAGKGPTPPTGSKPINPLDVDGKGKDKDKTDKNKKPETASIVTPPTGKAGLGTGTATSPLGKTGPTPPKSGPGVPTTGSTLPKTGPTPPKTGPAAGAPGTDTRGKEMQGHGQNATKRTAEAAAIAALGPALAARAVSRDDNAGKNERARQEVERQAETARAEANHLKTQAHDGHGQDKDKEAREKAQAIQPATKKDLKTAADGKSSASEDEKQRKAREQAAQMLAQAQPQTREARLQAVAGGQGQTGKSGQQTTDVKSVKGEIKTGTSVQGRPVVPTQGAAGVAIDPRTLGLHKTQQQLHQQAGDKGQQNSDIEVPGEDAVVVPGIGPDGRPVMVRIRPGQANVAGRQGQTVEAIAQKGPPMAGRGGATDSKVQPKLAANNFAAATTMAGAAGVLASTALNRSAIAQGKHV
ncbi:MAG: hypothetical protein ACREKE_05230, partial [bacterium]